MSFPKFTDGRLHETEVYARPRTTWPWKHLYETDVHARLHERKFYVDPDRYVPKIGNRTAFENHLLQSNNFGTSWTATGLGAIVADHAANPWDGATTVDKLPEAAGTTEHRVAQAHTFTAVPYVLWGIARGDLSRDYLRLLANDGATNFVAFFNLALGRVHSVSGSGATATIKKLNDTGYFLCVLSFTPAAGAGNAYANISTDGSTVSYAGDTAKGIHLAQMQLERATSAGPLILTTTAGRSILAPDRDPTDPFAFLDTESEPVDYRANLQTVIRVFARIPRLHTIYPGSRDIPKPDYTAPEAFNPFDIGSTSAGYATNYATWASLGAATYNAANGLFTAGDNKIYVPLKVPSAKTAGAASAGTFTLSRDGNTTAAINWNASAATILSALNGLASMGTDGVTASMDVSGNALANSGTGGSLTFYLTGGTDVARIKPITMNAASLTVNTSKNPTTSVIDTGRQQINLPTHLTVTAHGLSTGVDLAVVWSAPTTFILPTGYWGSIDANTLWISPYGNNAYTATYVGNYASTYTGPGSTAYAGGVRFPRARLVETYYLPGVTLGISSPADIAPSVGLHNPDDFLDALLTPLTGFQLYENSGPTPMRTDGLIYRVGASEINFNDLV